MIRSLIFEINVGLEISL